jgi:hypothetical protein
VTRARALGALAALTCAVALAACRTLPPEPAWTPLAADRPLVAQRLDWLREHAAARRSLRANARVSLSGAAGESFSRQLVLAERDAKLRIEVIGVLNQRVLVLASDGATYDLYRAETGKIESGPVDAGVLWRVARIPLLPSEAVGLLLAAPAVLDEPPRAETNSAGELRLVWPDRSVSFDAAGQLVSARVLAGPGGEELARARYLDWRGAGDAAFPYRMELDFAFQKGGALIEFRDAEVNAPLEPEWFRLKTAANSAASSAASTAESGEARP